MNRNLSNCEVARRNGFSGLQRDSNTWPVRSRCSVPLAELGRPILWRPANLLSSSTRERNETQNEIIDFKCHLVHSVFRTLYRYGSEPRSFIMKKWL